MFNVIYLYFFHDDILTATVACCLVLWAVQPSVVFDDWCFGPHLVYVIRDYCVLPMKAPSPDTWALPNNGY